MQTFILLFVLLNENLIFMTNNNHNGSVKTQNINLYHDFSNQLGRTFDLDVTTAEWIWVCIKNIDNAEHIKNEIRGLVAEAQRDFDKAEKLAEEFE